MTLSIWAISDLALGLPVFAERILPLGGVSCGRWESSANHALVLGRRTSAQCTIRQPNTFHSHFIVFFLMQESQGSLEDRFATKSNAAFRYQAHHAALKEAPPGP